MAKKMWGIMLLCFLALLFIPPKAVAADSGTCGEHLLWTLDDAGTLTISGTGDMEDFSSGNRPWDSSKVNAVVIESGVASIGSYAFFNSPLTRVIIPESVRSIGRGSFSLCKNLKNIAIPYGVTNIGFQALGYCGLDSIQIPDSVVTIESYAFLNCDSLTEITIPASVTRIDYGAFSDCDNLSKIEVDSENPAYTSVDGILFNKNKTTIVAFPCNRGGDYVIPHGVTKIYRNAFRGSINLKSVTIADSVTDIEGWAFTYCTSLEELKVDGKNTAYTSVDGVLFNKSRTSLIAYPGGLSGSYIIPNTVTGIQSEAFGGCSVTDITILNGVTSIELYLFRDCAHLAKVTIPVSVVNFGSTPFLGCSHLTDVYYSGDAEQWNAIEGVKDFLPQNVALHYGFADVPSTAYYADAVNWAVAQGITNGTTEATFSPNNTCTTANIITFLWRANGSPEPKVSNPFADVQTGQYYAKAAVWAYEKGMVTGRTFGGNANCTRAATMKYLWILSGRPSSSSNPFTDVSNNADYAQAVAWAVAQGVTNGKTATTFAPDDTCTRGQIVTFLLRYYMR